MMSRLPARTRVLLGLTAAAALVSAAVAVEEPARGEPLAWIAVATVAVFGELLSVRGDGTARMPTFTFSTSILVAAAALFGPAPAGAIAFVALAVVDFVRGEEAVRYLFNAAAYGIAGVWGAIAHDLVSTGTPVDLRGLLALSVLVAVHLAVQIIVVGSVVGSTKGASLLASISGYASMATAPQITEYSLGIVFVGLATTAPLFTPLLVPLLIAVFRAHARAAALHRETELALTRLASIVDERDPATFDHSHRVGELVRQLATALRLPDHDVETLTRAGRLHDLGKIMVDRSVLGKPGPLDDEEFEQMRQHPRVSARLLAAFGFARREAQAVALHHERFDGAGYYAVPGAQVSLAAHCLVLADSWDAMTSRRPYRDGMTAEVAAGRIADGLGSQFHPDLGRAFLAVQSGRPIEEVLEAGTIADLRTGLRDATTADPRGAVTRAQSELRRLGARLLAAAAAALVVVAAILPEVAASLISVAVGLASAAAIMTARRRRRIDTALAGLADSDPDLTVTALADILDPVAGVIWAGAISADRDGSLVLCSSESRGAATAADLVSALEERLVRVAADLRPGHGWVGDVDHLHVRVVPSPTGWIGIATERALPGRIADAIASPPGPPSIALALYVAPTDAAAA